MVTTWRVTGQNPGNWLAGGGSRVAGKFRIPYPPTSYAKVT